MQRPLAPLHRRVFVIALVVLPALGYLYVQYLRSPDRIARHVVVALESRNSESLWSNGLLQHQVEPCLDRSALGSLLLRLLPSGLKVKSVRRSSTLRVVNDTQYRYDVTVEDSSGVERQPWLILYHTESGWKVDEVTLLTTFVMHGQDQQVGLRLLAEALSTYPSGLIKGTNGDRVTAESVLRFAADPNATRSIFLEGEQPDYRW